MSWILLQILAVLAFLWHSPREDWWLLNWIHPSALLAFHLIWLGRCKFQELRILGSVFFSSLVGLTTLMCLCNGPLWALGLFWPALIHRMENSRDQQRLLLVLLQFGLALASPGQTHCLFLNIGLAMASLPQVLDTRPARWANTAALTLCSGPLLEALFFPPNMAFPQLAGDPTQVARAILLLSLPQMGLRMLGGESGRDH